MVIGDDSSSCEGDHGYQTCSNMSVYVGKSSYALQFSFFNIFATLLRIHNSLTPTNIPIASTQPFCHNTTSTSTYNHPSNFLHFQPVDVSFWQLSDWTYQLLTLHS